MSLLLIITSYHKITPGQCSEKRLEQGQLSIGRAPECDWHLPDPERLVSSQHCIVQFREGAYYLTDTSTNGVLFKHSGVQLRRGNSERLHDGDVLQLGSYLLEVRLEAGALTAPQQAQDPFAHFTATPAAGGAVQGFDELLRSMNSSSAAVSGADPFAPAGGFTGQETHPNLFDFATSTPAESNAAFSRSRDDHLAAQNQHFSAPKVHFENPVEVAPRAPVTAFAGIPEDWNVTTSSQPEAALADPFAGMLAAEVLVREPVSRQPQAEEAAVALEAAVRANKPMPSHNPIKAKAPTAVGDEPDLLQAFLRGAGLERMVLQPAERVAQMEAIGRSYRGMVAGLVDVLRARSSLKGEFRMSHTTIQPVENNPLKFAPNVDEAMLLLLRHGNSAFMSPDQAVSESFTDLKAHQLAVMAGTQAAIKHLLKRFEPSALETRLDSPGLLAALLPGARQARYWELFTELYVRLSREAEDDFQELFGREFARAYEEQIAQLQRR